jgi:hypothetical protein
MLSQAVKELENRLLKLNNVSYDSIDSLMRKIMKSYDITAKELHNAFKQKNKKTPDNWIKGKMKKLQNKSISESSIPKTKVSVMSKINPENAKLRKLDTKVNYTNPNEEVSLVEKILGEEKCGKGMYWCNTDQVCKPLQGLKVPGQKANPTETGIGKPVAEGSCTHTKKGTSCPVHGMNECPSCNESNTIASNSKSGRSYTLNNESAYVELINLISAGSIEEENPCWKGYTQVGMKTKNGKEVPNCVPVKKGVKKAKGYKKESVDEAVRMPAQTGNNIFVTLSWRGKYYTIQIFFPQAKIPSRLEITDEIQKIYPGSRVVTYRVAELKQGEPLIYAHKGGDGGKLGSNKNYVKPMGEQREIEPPKEKVGALTNINIPQSEREAARQRTLAKAAAKRKEREMKEEIEIEEGILSDIADKIKGRKVIGKTGSGKNVYAANKTKKSNVKYAGQTQDEIKNKKTDLKRIEKVKKGQYDDPWLRSSPAAERRVHYQQLRGEGVEIIDEKK